MKVENLKAEEGLDIFTMERHSEKVIENIHNIKQEAPLKLGDSSLVKPKIYQENNRVICETFHIKEELEPMQDEDEIKQEIIELGEYELAVTESVDESKNDFHPSVCKELVTGLEKIDYSTLVKPRSNRNRSGQRKMCEHCGQTFDSQYRLAAHRVKEHAPIMMLRNYHCDQCDKSYCHQTKLATHRANIHGIGEGIGKKKRSLNHTCIQCKEIFPTWRTLVYHRKHIHGEIIDSTKIVQCSVCSTKFTSAEEMAEHHCLMGVARLRERPFKCDLCDKAYHAKFHLELHFSAHPEYHNIKCDECPKGFFNEITLNMHKRSMHITEEAYLKCLTCKKRFKTNQNFKRHQELHPDTRKRALRVHMQTHNKER